MDFKTRYPDYAAIESHIQRARIERSLYLGEAIANAIAAGWRAVSRLTVLSKEPWPARDALAKGWTPQD